MKPTKLIGTGTALVTPFNTDGSVDYKSLEKLVNFQIEKGIDYLVVMGTTGESATLNRDEKKAVIKCVVDTAVNRVPIVMGIGGNNTLEVAKSASIADVDGIEAILSVCPYYNKPSQNGIYEHYKAVAEASQRPVLLYNVPGRTGVNMKAETSLRLANDCKNIIGVKEASGNLDQIGTIIKNKPTDFLVISGDDSLTLPTIALGADGVISVVSNAYPKQFSDMIRFCLKGDFASARPLHYSLTEFIEALFAEGSPSGIKAALEVMGICKNEFRLPVVNVSNTMYQHIEKLVKSIK